MVDLSLPRPERERLFRELQTVVLRDRKNQTRTSRPDPRAWAYGFAGHPRAFINELIPGWEDAPDWTAWRAFISAVFGEPFKTAGEWHAFRRCTQLEAAPPQRPASVWMPIGRRGGKSRCLAAIAVYLGCCYDWGHHLVPGELGILPVLAQDRRSARTIMGYVKSFLSHPKLQPLVRNEQVESILLEGQILIEVVTASFSAIRNRTVIAALLDEIAFWPTSEDSANPDHEILNALSPAMATIPNALILGASSPYARRGVLWDQYERWYGKPGGALVWKAGTRTMNPTVPQSFIDQQYADDPASAAAEYGAEFRSDVDAFVSRETLDAAIMRDVHELAPAFGVSYRAFVDPSGGSSDSFTLAIGHIDKERRGVLDVLREVRPPFSPEAVVDEFVQTLRPYKCYRVRGDHYGGDWPGERFRKSGIGYEEAKKRKSDIYLEFLPLLNAGRVSLLDDRRMFNQFLNLERRTTRGGLETIDHMPGSHDDLANVAAGVMVELLGKHDPTIVDPGVLARATRMIIPHNVPLGSTPRW